MFWYILIYFGIFRFISVYFGIFRYISVYFVIFCYISLYFRFQNKENAPIEVFKTYWKGFGVRALKPIPKETKLNSFISKKIILYFLNDSLPVSLVFLLPLDLQTFNSKHTFPP